ncbi:hypothetical protein [Methanoregula sp.]|uniref:hypothetical protein n=1 Tax=Methanoregula sp. TaxID=2052170 RepID=UPI003BAF0496
MAGAGAVASHQAGAGTFSDERTRSFLYRNKRTPETRKNVSQMEGISTTQEDVITPGAIASGATYSNRINPCGTVSHESSQVAGETTTIILHPGEGGKQAVSHKRYSRNSSHVHEAMRLLATYEYNPIRLAESSLPISIIGFRQDDPLLVFVISARKPVPSAARLHEDFKEPVECLCRMAGSMRYRIMIWVHSPACGWRYYQVYPGGLAYDLKFPGSLGH